MKTTPTAAKASLQVSEFTVSERWVQITATIRMEFIPKFRPEADPDRALAKLVSGYLTALNIETRSAKDNGRWGAGLCDISLDAAKWGYKRRNSEVITFRIREWAWRNFLADCEFIGHPPEAVIRGAFGSRANGDGRPGLRN